MRIFLVAALLVAFLAIIFALQNASPIIVTFGVWRVTASLALILLLTLGIGFVTGLLVSMPAIIRRNMDTGKYKRQAKHLETELADVKQELVHHQHLLAQANTDLDEQQQRLHELEARPQSLLPESSTRETAELVDDGDDWI